MSAFLSTFLSFRMVHQALLPLVKGFSSPKFQTIPQPSCKTISSKELCVFSSVSHSNSPTLGKQFSAAAFSLSTAATFWANQPKEGAVYFMSRNDGRVHVGGIKAAGIFFFRQLVTLHLKSGSIGRWVFMLFLLAPVHLFQNVIWENNATHFLIQLTTWHI